MDISNLQKEVDRNEEVVDLPIYDAAGEPYVANDGSPCTIGVVGLDSSAVRAYDRKIQRKTLRQRTDTRTTPEQLETQRIGRCVVGVKRWHGWTDEGEPAEVNDDNVRQMLKTAPHIFRQVEEGMRTHADFLKTPSGS